MQILTNFLPAGIPSDWLSANQGQLLETLWGQIIQIGSGLFQSGQVDDPYEVLDLESTLDIHDARGQRATFRKIKKIRYLQNNVVAFLDHAWGDGDILHNYRSNRGIPVDFFRSGYKTYILLSLRDFKNKGDADEFNIQWNIRQGFLTSDGYWGTDIGQKMKHVKVNILFPPTRRPTRVILEENTSKRTLQFDRNPVEQLPDGRWKVTWETWHPRVQELYVIRWNW